ncbi:MAG: hypothetical protein K2W82_14315 [Candidatus Obscuribacterales bacterium]|nr:hypothetical protein [Candidatus Obscuribacterales bacterium]
MSSANDGSVSGSQTSVPEAEIELPDYYTLCRKSSLDPRIMMVGPNTVLDYGYNILLTMIAPKGSTIRETAIKAVARQTAYCEFFNPTSPTGGYVNQLMMAANAFAAGLERRKRIADDRITAAKEEYDRFLCAFSQGQWVTAAVLGAFKVFFAGGVAFLISFFVLKFVGMSDLIQGTVATEKKTLIDPQYVSLAFAGGFGLLTAGFRGWWQGKRIREASKKRDEGIDAAIDWYAKEALREYQLAASTVSKAWETLTRIPAPNTEAMENLLRSLLEREFADKETGKAIPTKRTWRFWKRTHEQAVPAV